MSLPDPITLLRETAAAAWEDLDAMAREDLEIALIHATEAVHSFTGDALLHELRQVRATVSSAVSAATAWVVRSFWRAFKAWALAAAEVLVEIAMIAAAQFAAGFAAALAGESAG